MSITTEEAEQLATVHDWTAEDEQTSTGLRAGAKLTATALRSLAAERDALKADLLAARNGAVAASENAGRMMEERNAAWQEMEGLKAENARLREALDFYGDVSKYPAPFTGGMGALWQDCGQIARAALGEKG